MMNNSQVGFNYDIFLLANERFATLADIGVSEEFGCSIRRNAELLAEAIEWDRKHDAHAAQKHAKKIYMEATHIRGYMDIHFKNVSGEELVEALDKLAESVKPLAEELRAENSNRKT